LNVEGTSIFEHIPNLEDSKMKTQENERLLLTTRENETHG